MVGHTKGVQQILKRSSHKVLVQVTNDYIFTVVLMKLAIEAILEEYQGLRSLTLGFVTNTQERVCPELKERELQMIRYFHS